MIARFGGPTAWSIVLLLGAARVASGQTLPPPPEDSQTVGAGNIALGIGADASHADVYPVSGLYGTLTRLGLLNVSLGVSAIADIEFSGGVHNHLAITRRDPSAPLASALDLHGDASNDVEDAVIGAKVRFLPEAGGRPSFAVEFLTRLPNSKHDSGLGMDTTDFHFGFLAGKTAHGSRLVANVGWSILQDPVHDGIQNDVVTYGVSMTRPLAAGVDLVANLSGRYSTRHGTPPVGTESRSIVRVDARYAHGRATYSGGLLFGVTSYDPSWGIEASVSWLFHAFKIP